MAFCNSCGASLDPGAKFCAKCGGAVAAVTPATTTPPAAVAPSAPAAGAPAKSGSGLKIVLIIFAVLFGLAILAVVGVGVVGWQIARHSRIQKNGDQVHVQTPFGSVESTDKPDEALRGLGIDVYPGARPLKGASVASFGGIHTVTASFECDDSPDKVAEFYKSRMPNANVAVSDPGHSTIVDNQNNGVTTINIQTQGGKTRLQITNVKK